MGSMMTLTPEDAEAIPRVSRREGRAPVVRTRRQIVYGNKNWVPTQIDGATPAFLEVRDWRRWRRRAVHRPGRAGASRSA